MLLVRSEVYRINWKYGQVSKGHSMETSRWKLQEAWEGWMKRGVRLEQESGLGCGVIEDGLWVHSSQMSYLKEITCGVHNGAWPGMM